MTHKKHKSLAAGLTALALALSLTPVSAKDRKSVV